MWIEGLCPFVIHQHLPCGKVMKVLPLLLSYITVACPVQRHIVHSLCSGDESGSHRESSWNQPSSLHNPTLWAPLRVWRTNTGTFLSFAASVKLTGEWTITINLSQRSQMCPMRKMYIWVMIACLPIVHSMKSRMTRGIQWGSCKTVCIKYIYIRRVANYI